MRAGDHILRIDGKTLQSHRDLPKIVAATKAGTQVKLDVLRQGRTREVAVRVGQMPGDEDQIALQGDRGSDSGQGRLGLYLAPLTPEVRARGGFGPDQSGVLVARVEPESPAARAGIEAGSLISMVGSEPVKSPDQVVAAVRKAADEERKSVILRVEQDGRVLFVAVPLAA